MKAKQRGLSLLVLGVAGFFSDLWLTPYLLQNMTVHDWWNFPSVMTAVFLGAGGIALVGFGGFLMSEVERGSRSMSQWGVFRGQHGEFHITPVDEKKRVSGGHILGIECFCRPKLDETWPPPIWVHQDPERGGTNA